MAAESGHVGVVQLLLDSGADIDAADNVRTHNAIQSTAERSYCRDFNLIADIRLCVPCPLWVVVIIVR